MEFFDYLKINIASPERIKAWGTRRLSDGCQVGEVFNYDTLYYKDLRPIPEGLFCDRTFGSLGTLKCRCRRYEGDRHKKIVCKKCGIEVSVNLKSRRHNLGLITLNAPVIHLWYLLNRPSYLAKMLNMKVWNLIRVVYQASYIILTADKDKPCATRLLAYKNVTTITSWNLFQKKKRLKTDIPAWDSIPTNARVAKGSEGIKELLDKNWLQGCRAITYLLKLLQKTSSIKGLLQTSFFSQTSKKSRPMKRKYRLFYKKRLRQLKLIIHFQRTKIRPSWMVLDALPVLPPDLRPMIRIRRLILCADFNDLYRLILLRNNRIRLAAAYNVPISFVETDRILLQEAVDWLIQNGKRGPAYRGRNKKQVLKSLTDIIKGKKGRFRKNLLGKRVDYSGRSVIVVGPQMSHFECGLPRELALGLFESLIICFLVQKRVANYISVMDIIESRETRLWTMVSKVVFGHPILLNRAPTLHRSNIQAFLPRMVNENALYLHPLVCTGYNADFDGDQMAVHLPLSLEAQYETLDLLPVRNFWSPGTGEIALIPSQDVVLGTLYLTEKIAKRQINTPLYFNDLREVLIAYYNSGINLHTFVWVQFEKTHLNTFFEPGGVKQQFGSRKLYCHPLLRFKENLTVAYMTTTPGRILLNNAFELIKTNSKR